PSPPSTISKVIVFPSTVEGTAYQCGVRFSEVEPYIHHCAVGGSGAGNCTLNVTGCPTAQSAVCKSTNPYGFAASRGNGIVNSVTAGCRKSTPPSAHHELFGFIVSDR